MHRSLAVLIVGLLLAFALQLGNVLPDAPPSAAGPLRETERVSAAIGFFAAARPAEPIALALTRDEVVPVRSPAPRAIATGLTFLMTGASPEELHGVAFVRRKDGHTVELPFDGSRFGVNDRSSLDGVSLRVSGFAIAWPKLTCEVPAIEVPMQRAGAIRVRLIDAEGRPLAHRAIGTVCQGSTNATPPAVVYSGTLRGATGADGVALLDHAWPGTHDVFAARLAEWEPTGNRGIVVRAGETTYCELVAAIPSSSRYGGFRLQRAFAPMLTGFENDVHSHVFATSDGRQYMLNFLGDEVRCVVQGRLGDLLSGSIVPVDLSGGGQALPPISVPITVTVGAVVDWRPVWIR